MIIISVMVEFLLFRAKFRVLTKSIFISELASD